MLRYTSENNQMVDEPFAKLISAKQVVAYHLGIPPISQAVKSKKAEDVLTKAHSILGLSGSDSYIAKRIRHLDYIVRNSRFAKAVTWRSGLASLNAKSPSFNDFTGYEVINITSDTLGATLLKVAPPVNNELDWTVTASGTVGGTDAFVFINGISTGVNIKSAPQTYSPIDLGKSGYTLTFQNFGANGNSINFNARLSVPYSGNLIPLLLSIKDNTEFTALLEPKEEYLTALTNPDSPEDAIAAFILSVNDAT